MKNLLLLLLVFTIAAFSYTSFQLKGDAQSDFNRSTRFKLAKYPLARKLWNLHNYGDARLQYFSGKEPLILEIVRPSRIELGESLLGQITKKMETVLNRPIQVVDTDYIKDGELFESDLAEIVRTKRRHLYPGQPNLFLVIADVYKTQTREIGSTYKEFGIVISYKRLEELSRNYFSSLDQYLESTILHEFGHQLGLEHNTGNDCIMNMKVNHPDESGYFSGSYTPVEFCEIELKQLQSKIK